MLVSLWTWAIQNAYSGDLSTCSDRTISDAAHFRRKPETFVKALMTSGWLDANRRLHDWEEYTLLLIKRMDRQKEQNRERVQRYRNKPVTKHENSSNAPCNSYCNVTVTQCNAPTIPIPIPNLLSTAGNKTVDGSNPPQGVPAPFDGKAFTAFWDAYPSKIDREGAWAAWSVLRPDSATAKAILSALSAWKSSDRWQEEGGRFVPQAANFLSKGHWRSPPTPVSVPSQPPKKERCLDSDEQAAILRMLQEEENR